MKVTLDTKTGEMKVGKSTYKGVNSVKKQEIDTALREFIRKNTKLSEYENDNMWMSYRYCIGRHTIASHMHASDIWHNCKGRMSKDKELFTAFDINREIEQCLGFIKPNFYFPITSLNRIYTSAIDIFCEFLEDYNIKSTEELLKYKDVHVILTDNERGYKIETVTWEEWLRAKVKTYIQNIDDAYDEEYGWEIFTDWKENKGKFQLDDKTINYFKKITKDIPNPEYFWMHDIEDLFIWNDLVHCFDHEHHHKSILKDGTECTWFWSWRKNYEIGENGYIQWCFGYHRIRVDLDKWNGSVITIINDDSIKENLY